MASFLKLVLHTPEILKLKKKENNECLHIESRGAIVDVKVLERTAKKITQEKNF